MMMKPIKTRSLEINPPKSPSRANASPFRHSDNTRSSTRATFLVRGTSDCPAGLQQLQSESGCASSGLGLICSNNTVGPPQQQTQQARTQSKRLSLDSRTSLESLQKPDYGLLVTLHKQEDGTSRCQLSFEQDEHYQRIHPNAYAPACLKQMHKLGGGGSGVAVFEGHDPRLGDVVMKHGGDKDLKELFALATIHEELKERGNHSKEAEAAAEDLQSRIPEFRMIYISPHHLGEKRRELWYRLSHMYKYSSRNLLVLPEVAQQQDTESQRNSASARSLSSIPSLPKLSEDEPSGELSIEKATPLQNRRNRRMGPQQVPSRNGLSMTQSGTVSGHRDISVYATTDKTCSIDLLGDSLTVSIPSDEEDRCWGDGWQEPIIIPGNGYTALKAIAADLRQLMKDHKWKFTLGQRRIGGNNPKTGNLWLYSGQLEGKLLDNLIAQNVRLVKDLVTLTTPEEQSRQYLRAVQEEMVRFEEEEDINPGDISDLSDSFVGNAIKKNFNEESGRMPMLVALGRQFREISQQQAAYNNDDNNEPSDHSEGSYGDFVSTETMPMEEESNLVLTPEEEIPAMHLGALTRAGALMGDTFQKTPLEGTVLEMSRFYWRTVLRAAISPRRGCCGNNPQSGMAVARLWTCGLTDAGVHNLFLTEDSFWLFDLGQPQLYSAPGFLTKFLFSFFHTLGMEETEDGGWVRRFEHNPVTRKLALTPESESLLAKAYDAFEITLDRLIDELFAGDHSLRWLLLQYVTLQLISDASFCLQRWTTKGGGRRRTENHQTGIEKWLWRAIWDLYVAFDINSNDTWTRLYVEHPSHRDSLFFTEMRELIESDDARAVLERTNQDGKESKEEESSAS